MKVPVGLLGPVHVKTELNSFDNFPPNKPEMVSKDYFIPFATTDSALMETYERGAQALLLSGGVTAAVVKNTVTRAPVSATAISGSKFIIHCRCSSLIES